MNLAQAIRNPARLAALALVTLSILQSTSARASEEIWVLTTANNLINFSSASPAAFSLRPITGLAPGEAALAIDFRPAAPTGRLYVLGSTGRFYRIDNPSTGAAVAVGSMPFTPALSGTEFGFDFNPTVDRIRVVSDAEQNLRGQPDLGTIAFSDSALYYVGGDPNFGANPNVTAAAYTNNFAGATTTMLFDIDSQLDILAIQSPPNAGRLTTVGAVGIDVSHDNGFDISGTTAIAYLVSAWGPNNAALYTVNLASGGATLVGPIGCNERPRGLSVGRELPTPATNATWGRIKGQYR